MIPQYQFNLGQADPLLSIAQNNPEGYISVIEQELQKLNNVKQQLIQAKQPTQQNINNAVNIWNSINNEIASMTNDQKELLAKDETYISIERELQLMIQEELINSVKDKVAASPRGKELLEKQLNNIKVKKEEIILKMKILVVLKLGITLKQLIEFILDLLLRQYVFLNMLPLLLFIYLMQKIYYFSLFFFK